MRRAAMVLALVVGSATSASGLTPYLVRDINPVPEAEPSTPSELMALGGRVVFAAFESSVGREPWATDGSASGTVLLADTCAGTCWTSPFRFLLAGQGRAFFIADESLWVTKGTPQSTFRLTGSDASVPDVFDGPLGFWDAARRRLYFGAFDVAHGIELWRSDGTAAGTFRVADLDPDGSSEPGSFASFRGRVFFSARIGATRGLWVTDGTRAGTRLVKGGSGPTAPREPSELRALPNVLVFLASTPVTGEELWRSDGTVAGTLPLPEVQPGPAGGSIRRLSVLGRRLLFSAADGVRGSELWASDGTPSGTLPLTQLPGSGGILTGAWRLAGDGRMLFLARDPAHGAEPWVTDGTPAGTKLVRDVWPGPQSSADQEGTAVRLGERLFLPLSDANGQELWSTNGTAAGTRRVKDLCEQCASAPVPLAAFQDRLLFVADEGRHGRELWSTDGTAPGTLRATNFADRQPFQDPLLSATTPSALLFAADDGEHGSELWRSDGTALGSGLVVDLARRDLGGSFPCSLGEANGQLWFQAADGDENDSHLWISDGTSAGTRFVQDTVPGLSTCPPMEIVAAGGKTFLHLGFVPRLWVSDGTSAGTVALAGGSSPRLDVGLFSLGSQVLFFSDSREPSLLWRSDGTPAGTVPIEGSAAAITQAEPRGATVLGARLFFAGRSEAGGAELWASDGTESGTTLVADMIPGSGGSFPRHLVAFGGKLFFFAYTTPGGAERLWSSDGTGAGTQVRLDLQGERTPTAADDRLYLFAHAPDVAPGLWVTDGTPAGSHFLAAVLPSPLAGQVAPVAVGRRLFFAGPSATSEHSVLWTSDGTAESTRPVLDQEGHEVQGPLRMRAFAGRLVAITTVDGQKTMWQSDGTDAGTFAIQALESGPFSLTTELTVAGDHLFFPAYDAGSGVELWALTAE